MNMETWLSAFQGIEAMLHSNPQMVLARFGLIILGMVLIYLGKKGTLEPLLMIPMGLGMAVINASVMMFDPLNLHGGSPPIVKSRDPNNTQLCRKTPLFPATGCALSRDSVKSAARPPRGVRRSGP